MVYLVDDDADDLGFLQEALGHYSYEGGVNTVLNGQLLMDRLGKNERSAQPDVIVLDLNMPLKDGFTVLKEIKSNPTLKSIPVIVLTASSRREDEIRCFELGCNFFLTKPSNMDGYRGLVSMVKTIISRKDIHNTTHQGSI